MVEFAFLSPCFHSQPEPAQVDKSPLTALESPLTFCRSLISQCAGFVRSTIRSPHSRLCQMKPLFYKSFVLPPTAASATIMCHSFSAAPIDRSPAVNATSPVGDTTAIDHATAIDSTIVTSCAWRIGRVSTRLPIAAIISAGGAVPQPATNHTPSIDRAASIDPATAVDATPSVYGSTPVGAAPASDCRHQRIPDSGTGDDRMRLPDRADGLRWLCNKQCSCRCECQRGDSHESVHLQLLAQAGETAGSH
jgi:hypothetical protein